MARSLIGGLLASGSAPTDIRVAELLADKREDLTRDFRVACFRDHHTAVCWAEVVVLAVKPQSIPSARPELSNALLGEQQLLLSIVAGARLDQLERWFGARPIVRCMPNSAALIGAGATGLCANARVTPAQKIQAESIMNAVGLTRWID